jgi:hypothetical protein
MFIRHLHTLALHAKFLSLTSFENQPKLMELKLESTKGLQTFIWVVGKSALGAERS